MIPPRWGRRVLLPVTLTVESALLAGLSVTWAGAAAVSPLTARRRVLRLAWFGVVYLSTDLGAVGACGWLWLRKTVSSEPDDWWEDAHYELLRWAVGRALRTAAEVFDFRVELLEPGDVGPLVDDGPVLVLSRHGGPGDSFVVVHALLDRYDRRPRIVLKDVLALDPALDLILSRLSCCFLPSRRGRGDDLPARLAALAAPMGARDALVVFPEGGNWTPSRRQRAIAKLRERGKRRAAQRAERMLHVMPPRPAGVLACLDARPDARIVVVAHTGLEEIVTADAGWRALPLRRPMELAWWEADRSEVPEGEDARTDWLHDQWGHVEDWITAHPSRHPLLW